MPQHKRPSQRELFLRDLAKELRAMRSIGKIDKRFEDFPLDAPADIYEVFAKEYHRRGSNLPQ